MSIPSAVFIRRCVDLPVDGSPWGAVMNAPCQCLRPYRGGGLVSGVGGGEYDIAEILKK